MPKVSTVLLSGGIDSMVCLDIALSTGRDVQAVYVDYGQKAHHFEFSAASSVANHFGVSLQTLSLNLGRGFGRGNIDDRNAALVFSSAMALANVSGELIIGIHTGTDYLDCSPDFISACQSVLNYGRGEPLILTAPLQRWTKAKVLAYAVERSLPISKTYSCEEGKSPVCGGCSSCKDRMELKCH